MENLSFITFDLRADHTEVRNGNGGNVRGFDDGLSLHSSDLGVSDGQTAAAVTHHRVELVEVCDDLLDVLDGLALSFGHSFDVSFFGGYEFVKRRIQETDGDRVSAQSFEQTFEVFLLHGFDLRKGGFALFNVLSADHFTESADTVGFEEHMFGTAEADALCAEGSCLTGVFRGVGVGAYAKFLVFIGQSHDASEVAAGGIRGDRGDELVVDLTGGAVKGDRIAFAVNFTVEREALVLLVHLDVAAAGNAAGTHTTGNNGSV